MTALTAFPSLLADDLRPRDLTPVTWLETPHHAPVELVRDGKTVAVVYVADPGAAVGDWFRKAEMASVHLSGSRGWEDPFPDPSLDSGDHHYVRPPDLRRGDPEAVRISLRALRGLEPGAFVHATTRHHPPALLKLLHELVEVVRIGTGATLEFVEKPPSADTPAIVIGDCEETRRAGIDAGNLPPEGFVVKTAPNRLFLVGSTQAPLEPQGRGAMPNDGTAWALADVLERLVGVRWYWPAKYGGRSVPHRASLIIPPVHYRDQPVFHLRQNYRYGGDMELCGTYTSPPCDEANMDMALAFEGHNVGDQIPLPFAPRVRGGRTPGHHWPLVRYGSSLDFMSAAIQASDTGSRMVVSRAEGDPLRSEAVFAINEDGTRNTKWNCFSAPETIDACIARLEPYWNGTKSVPTTHNAITKTSFTVWFPGSGGLACHCPACKKTASRYRDDRALSKSLVAKHGERRACEIVEELAHEQVFGLFLQGLCKAVKLHWPDKKVVYHASESRPPAGITFPDNLRVAFVSPGGEFCALGQAMHPSHGHAFEDRIRGWGAVTTWGSAAGPSDWTYGPVQYPHVVRDFYGRNKDFIRGSFLTTYNSRIFITSAPTHYVWRRVLWNPDLDVDATLDEMCRRLFGPGADAALELLRLQCDRWENTPLSRPLTAENLHRDQLPGVGGMGYLAQEFRLPDDQFRQIWPPDVVARMKALRDRALAAIEKEGDAGARFRPDAPAEVGAPTSAPALEAPAGTTPGQARQAFLYWTWTFDVFLEEAGRVHRQIPPDFVRERGTRSLEPVERLPEVLALDLGNGVELKLKLVRPGEFLMGSATTSWAHHRSEAPQHSVRMTRPFHMGAFEVTEAQYESVMGEKPLRRGANQPVANVSWNDATDFCRKLSRKTGTTVRLPTEAEWEYACRAGTATQWFFGDVDDLAAKGSEYLGYHPEVPVYKSEYPHDVGTQKPNAYGLYDMHGNVLEWCQDRYGEDYYAIGPTDNPTGPETGMFRVLRGGSGLNLAARNLELVRSARRTYGHPDTRWPEVGFRVVVEVGAGDD